MMATIPPERLISPAKVAKLFGVDAKTVTRWALSGKLKSIRTLGGHRRFDELQVMTLLKKSEEGMSSEDS
jgi:excisionase family DNA binding protein